MNVDLGKYVGAVTREIRSTVKDGQSARVLVAERMYDTTVEDLWNALTTAERIPRWFLPITGELKLGGRFQFVGNAGGSITRCDAPNHLAVTWEAGGHVSWVDIRLEAKGKGTRLELEHTACVPEDMWNTYGPGAVGVGWELGLMGLGKHIATRAPVDPKEGEAFSTTPEGVRIITAVSEGWGEASAKFGTPRDAAMAAAAKTTGFYTGQG